MPEKELRNSNPLLSKTVLIGINYIDSQGKLTEQKQIHGIITRVDKRGISVRLQGFCEGELFRLPPDINALKVAPAGKYSLTTTGEVIINPDLLVEYDVNQPNP